MEALKKNDSLKILSLCIINSGSCGISKKGLTKILDTLMINNSLKSVYLSLII